MYIQSTKKFWFDNGTVPITDDVYVDKQTSQKLGFNTIKIRKGLYSMELSKSGKNTLFVEVETSKGTEK